MSSCQAGLSSCSGTSGTDCRGTCPLLHCGSWRLPVWPHCHLGGQCTCAWPEACLHGFHRLHCSIGLHLQITSARVKSLRISGWRQQSVRPRMGLLRAGPDATVQATLMNGRPWALVRGICSPLQNLTGRDTLGSEHTAPCFA